MKEASGVGMYTIEKLVRKNIGIATEMVSISVSVAKLLVLPVCGLCFHFRFVSDAVLRSRTTSVLVEVDRACPKTVSEPFSSHL